MLCSRCGRPVGEDAATCVHCGAGLSYTVLGADGNQYGPYPPNTLRRYLADGAIDPNAQVSQGGGPWVPAGQVLGSAPAAAYPPSYAPGVPRPARWRIQPWQIAAIALGVLLLVGVGVLLSVFGPSPGRIASPAGDCQRNLKLVGLAMIMYAVDYDEVLPNSATWRDAIVPYLKYEEALVCPGSGRADSYEMNPYLSQVHLGAIPNPSQTPMVYDAGFPEGKPPHLEGWSVCFADGHCEVVSSSEAAEYRSP
jgi:hypothetical protein